MGLIVLRQSPVHNGETYPDAVSESLQGREIDRICEVCGQQLVTLRFELTPVRHEAFHDRNRHRPPVTTGLFRCPAGTNEVDVGGAAWVGSEVKQRPRLAATWAFLQDEESTGAKLNAGIRFVSKQGDHER